MIIFDIRNLFLKPQIIYETSQNGFISRLSTNGGGGLDVDGGCGVGLGEGGGGTLYSGGGSGGVGGSQGPAKSVFYVQKNTEYRNG